MLKAFYYGSKKQGFILTLTTGNNTFSDDAKNIKVSGKIEARKIAVENNAQAWNF